MKDSNVCQLVCQIRILRLNVFINIFQCLDILARFS